MQRGTRVGQAYIAVTADGDGINEEIAGSFDDVDYDSISDRFGKELGDNIRRHLSDLDSDFSDAADNFDKEFATRDAIGVGLRKQVASMFDIGALDPLIERVSDHFGERIGESMNTSVNAAVLNATEEMLARSGASGESYNKNAMTQDVTYGSVDKAIKAVEAELKVREAGATAYTKFLKAEEVRRLADQARSSAIRSKQIRFENDERMKSAAAYEKLWTGLLDKRESEEAAYTKYLRGEETKRLADAARAGALRTKQEQYQMDQRNKSRLEYESAWMKMLDAQADDSRFVEYRKKAEDALKDIKFNPRVDKMSVDKIVANLSALMEKRDDLTLKMGLDIPLRERAKIEAQLALINGEIDLNVNEDRLNATLIQALDKAEKAVSRNRPSGTPIADTLGKSLGAGSRNNALNLFGSTIGNVTGLVENLARTSSTMFARFNTGFAQAGEGANLVTRAMSGLSSVFSGGGGGIGGFFSSIVSAAPAAIAGITVVGVALSSLISVVSALGAMVVGLASALASGLTLALGVAGAGMTALVVTAGLAVAAFTNLDKAQKRLLSNSFKPVVDEFKEIGRTLAEDMAPSFATWGNNVTKALQMINPLVDVMGRSLGKAGEELTGALSGPGFQNLTNSLGNELPTIIANLSSAAGDALNGIGGLFAGLMPTVTRFTGYLSDVAQRFSEWANSADGQNSIKEFADTASDSLKSLWNGVREFSGLIADVLFNDVSQNAGQTMFDGLADSFASMRASFQANVDNGNVERWFNDAIEFGKDLGVVIKDLAGVWSSLYDSGVLAGVGDALRIVADALKFVVDVGGTVVGVLDRLPGGFGTLAAEVALAAVVFPRLASGMSAITGLVGPLAGGLARSATGMQATAAQAAATQAAVSKMAAAARTAAGVGGLALLMDSGNRTNQTLETLQGVAGGALAGFAVGGPVGAGIGAIATGLFKVVGNIRDVDEATKIATTSAADYMATLDSVTGAITEQTEARIYDSLMAGEAAGAADLLGTSQGKVIKAIMGESAAREQVLGLMDRQQEKADRLYEQAMKLSQPGPNFDQERAEAKAKEAAAIERVIDALKAEGGALDDSTAAAARRIAVLKGVPEKVVTAFQSNSVKTKDDVADLARKYDLLEKPRKLKTLIEMSGFDLTVSRLRKLAAEGDDYGKKLKNLPKSVRTAIRADKLDVTTKGIAELARKYDTTPKKVITAIRAMGIEGTGKNVDDLGKKMKAVDSIKASLRPFVASVGKGLGDASKAAAAGSKAIQNNAEKVSQAKANLGRYLNDVGQGMNNARQTADRGSQAARQAMERGPASARADLGGMNASVSAGLANIRGTASAGGSSVGAALKSGIESGFSGVVSSLVNTAASAVRSAVAAARAAARAKSPSREMAEKVGQPLGEGIAAGIDERSRQIEDAARRAVDKGVKAAAIRLPKQIQKSLTATSAGGVKEALGSLEAQLRKKKSPAATAAARRLENNEDTTKKFVAALLAGKKVEQATLADYAMARGEMAKQLVKANEKLKAALDLRDSYNKSVADATRTFGDLTNAQAQVINGVQQTLTAGDITGGLQERLDKIRTFQDNLRLLLANGLSNAAYKQLVDKGVEGGGAYAQALVDGGTASIGQVNQLVDTIDNVSKQLGNDASDRLYQAGVNAAQGLVDGLTSQAAKLDKAAERLGISIAKAVKKALGIKSPSRVMIEAMGSVGDGLVLGLQGQQNRVGSAAEALSNRVAISPSLSNRMAAGNMPGGVSGNTVQHHWHITTPTADPVGVAREAINEMTGRLP